MTCRTIEFTTAATVTDLWRYNTRITLSDCQEWTGTRFANGYGRVGNRKAHRVVWEEHHGPIPPGLLVLHHCDNPPCVNPDHLYLGTHKDNARDRKLRERGVRGSRVNTAKLSEDQVHEIRRRADAGELHRSIALDFSVTQPMISLIARRAAWSHLPERERRPTDAERVEQLRGKHLIGRKKGWTPERRAKQAAMTAARSRGNTYNKGRKASPETRAKQSAARKAWWKRRRQSAE